MASSVEPASRRILADVDGDARFDHIVVTDSGLVIRIINRRTTLPVRAEQLAAADRDCGGRIDLILDGGAAWIPNAVLRGDSPGPGGGPRGGCGFAPVWDSSATYLEITTRHIVGDLDDDGAGPADAAILVEVLLGLDSNPLHLCRADVNGDGQADGLDVAGMVRATIP